MIHKDVDGITIVFRHSKSRCCRSTLYQDSVLDGIRRKTVQLCCKSFDNKVVLGHCKLQVGARLTFRVQGREHDDTHNQRFWLAVRWRNWWWKDYNFEIILTGGGKIFMDMQKHRTFNYKW